MRGIDLNLDLASPPVIVTRDTRTFDVVFEGRARNTRWKDWMVSVTMTLESTPGITRRCFYDLVADRPHRSSLAE